MAAHVDGPLRWPLERVLCREFDDVGVPLVAADTVRRILDAVTEQEQRLVDMLAIGRLPVPVSVSGKGFECVLSYP